MRKKLLPVLICTTFTFSFFNCKSQTNTKSGVNALSHLTAGKYNTGIGYYSLYKNTTGNYNTATGAFSLLRNERGSGNTATGNSALYKNVAGTNNTATGNSSLFNNQFGYGNTATGDSALFNNTVGFENLANGDMALYNNIDGNYSTGVGYGALYNNINGSQNSAFGGGSLYQNTSGYDNLAVGTSVLYYNNGSFNTAVGGYRVLDNNITGFFNTGLGTLANVLSGNLTNATAIGYGAVADASDKVRIGNTSVTSIGGQVGWTTYSDGKYKKDIKENVAGLAFINSLRPITYRVDIQSLNKYYNKANKAITDNSGINSTDKKGAVNTSMDKTVADSELRNFPSQTAAENQRSQTAFDRINEKQQEAVDAEMKKGEEASGKIIYTGFVAQEVEEAAKKLNFDFSGVDKPKSKDGLYGLRYDNFIAPLVKAVQELSKQSNEKDAKIDDLQKQINELKTLITGGKVQTGVTLSDASIEQNSPNPYYKTTTISYTLPQTYTDAQIVITGQNGKVLKQLNISGSGKGTVNVNASALANGTYTYTLLIDGKLIGSKQMILIK